MRSFSFNENGYLLYSVYTKHNLFSFHHLECEIKRSVNYVY